MKRALVSASLLVASASGFLAPPMAVRHRVPASRRMAMSVDEGKRPLAKIETLKVGGKQGQGSVGVALAGD